MLQEVICLNFQGNKSGGCTTEDGSAFTLNAMHGHDVHVVCFQQNQREEVRLMGETAGALMAETGMHNTNYVIYPGNEITSPQNRNNPHPGDPCSTLTNDSRFYVVGEKTNVCKENVTENSEKEQ